MKRGAVLLLALTLLAAAAVSVAHAKDSYAKYRFSIENSMLVPGHGGEMYVKAKGYITFRLVSSNGTIYTFAYTVRIEDLSVKGFPGNNTQAASILKKQLEQNGTIQVDYSKCMVRAPTGVVAGVAIYCNVTALTDIVRKLEDMLRAQKLNATVKLLDVPGGKEILLEGRGVKLKLVYLENGLLKEYYSEVNATELAAQAGHGLHIAGYSRTSMVLVDTDFTGTGGAGSQLIQAVGGEASTLAIAAAVGVAAAAAAVGVYALRRR